MDAEEGFHRFFFPAPCRIKSEAPADLRMAVEGMALGGMAVSAVAVSERVPEAQGRAGAERGSGLSRASEPHNA